MMAETGKRKIWLGILAATGVYFIYGLNVVLCKDLLSATELISPSALFAVRVGGAALLFWLASLFFPHEKLSPRDLALTLAASLLCITVPQYAMLWGITMASPYDASIVATLKPVFTMLIAFMLGREVFRWNLLAGVLLTFAGALVLVINFGGEPDAYATTPLGLMLLVVNGLSASFYFVLFKDFVARHSIVTLMKWMFLFAFLVALPLSAGELKQIDFGTFSRVMIAETAFLVLCATFLSYFLMPVGQRNLSPTHYCLFSYVQCVVAATVGIAMGFESFNLQKAVATLLLVAGVLVVRRS